MDAVSFSRQRCLKMDDIPYLHIELNLNDENFKLD